MDTKLKNEPVFLIAALCIFFPVGLIFLIRSDIKRSTKWLLAAVCGTIFILLLSLALLGRPHPIDPSSFDVAITRETLSPGQSGGLIVTNGDQYYTAYSVTTDNNVLQADGSIYTAVKPGRCTLTVTFEEEVRTVNIEVKDQPGTNSAVLASPGGERYHLTTAVHAGKKAVEMTEEDALMSGKTPCKTCYK